MVYKAEFNLFKVIALFVSSFFTFAGSFIVVEFIVILILDKNHLIVFNSFYDAKWVLVITVVVSLLISLKYLLNRKSVSVEVTDTGIIYRNKNKETILNFSEYEITSYVMSIHTFLMTINIYLIKTKSINGNKKGRMYPCKHFYQYTFSNMMADITSKQIIYNRQNKIAEKMNLS